MKALIIALSVVLAAATSSAESMTITKEKAPQVVSIFPSMGTVALAPDHHTVNVDTFSSWCGVVKLQAVLENVEVAKGLQVALQATEQIEGQVTEVDEVVIDISGGQVVCSQQSHQEFSIEFLGIELTGASESLVFQKVTGEKACSDLMNAFSK
jgi:hypothetical protein